MFIVDSLDVADDPAMVIPVKYIDGDHINSFAEILIENALIVSPRAYQTGDAC